MGDCLREYSNALRQLAYDLYKEEYGAMEEKYLALKKEHNETLSTKEALKLENKILTCNNKANKMILEANKLDVKAELIRTTVKILKKNPDTFECNYKKLYHEASRCEKMSNKLKVEAFRFLLFKLTELGKIDLSAFNYINDLFNQSIF